MGHHLPHDQKILVIRFPFLSFTNIGTVTYFRDCSKDGKKVGKIECGVAATTPHSKKSIVKQLYAIESDLATNQANRI